MTPAMTLDETLDELDGLVYSLIRKASETLCDDDERHSSLFIITGGYDYSGAFAVWQLLYPLLLGFSKELKEL